MRIKRVSLLCLAFLVLGSGAAYAAVPNQIKATVTSLKYIVEGQSFTPISKSKPVIINGEYYIPASVLKESTKINITADKSNLYIGDKKVEVPIIKEKIEGGYGSGFSKLSKYTVFNGVDYKEVMVSDKLFGSTDVILYPEGKYQTFTLKAFTLGYKAEVTVSDYKTDTVVKTIKLEPDTELATSEMNITGISKLRIRITSLESNSDSKGADVVILPTSSYK
ncbi:hypothetical protein KB559_11070 [Paenibacillus sp. Marseille-P2973]|uniref:hypothetical protein n=1 Tax=Paenibacillus sp. Marseille-P2973 TaxID=1871032 RepID=UPI001B36872B|nr:hypothetical protein [Paenibacillus sp. Marseille-P2973]MBQ4899378.1 hypothetical protein [Paenibacillus sp. Marseille-P2973]